MRPTKEKLKELHASLNSKEIAEMFSVHDSTVRQWFRFYGIKGYASGKRFSDAATLKKRRNNCLRWIEKSKKKIPQFIRLLKSRTKYVTQKNNKVRIFCLKHSHWFSEMPDRHVRSEFGGCKFCEIEGRAFNSFKKQESKFIQWFDKNRSDRLEIKSEFKGMTELMTFRCKVHDQEEDHKPTMLMSHQAKLWDAQSVQEKPALRPDA